MLLHPLAVEPYPQNDKAPHTGIADERAYYRDDASLMLVTRNRAMPAHGWFVLGRELRLKKEKYFAFPNIGFLGYAAGPSTHILDELALAEPLLARLPMRYRHSWRVGHYRREMPDGYEDTLKANDGKCKMTDTKLCAYYRHLHEVISGPLWSWSRIKTIALFNIGAYEALIDRDRYRFPTIPEATLKSLQVVVAERSMWNATGAKTFDEDGLSITVEPPSHAARIILINLSVARVVALYGPNNNI